MPIKTKLELLKEKEDKRLLKKMQLLNKSYERKLLSANKKLTKTKKLKQESISSLTKKLDKVFSMFIRTRDSKDGLATCFTCNKVLPIKDITNGHFISRKRMPTRWDERNCAAQCFLPCNAKFAGNGEAAKFAINLMNKYGDSIIRELHTLSETPYKADREHLKNLIKQYQALLK